MRYQEYFTPTTDAELYRLELIENLGHVLPLIKHEAERVLGRKIRMVMPIGSVVDPVHFNEGAELDIAFYLDGINSQVINAELSKTLQEHFGNLPVEDIGVINAIVLQRA